MRLRIISSFTLSDPLSGAQDVIWEGDVSFLRDDEATDAVNALIYRRFNVVEEGDRAELLEMGYKLPSLSAGDIIVWLGQNRHERSRMFMVDAVGFLEIYPGMGPHGWPERLTKQAIREDQ